MDGLPATDPLSRFVLFDLETTGLDPGACEVIEIAAVRVEGFEAVDRFEALVRPTGRLSLDVQRLTGIAPGDLAGADPWPTVRRAFLDFAAGLPLAAHNGDRFDRLVLDRDGALPHPALDTLEALALLFPAAPTGHSLAALAERVLATSSPQSHRAADDVNLLLDLLRLGRARVAEAPAPWRERMRCTLVLAGSPWAGMFAGAGCPPAGTLLDDLPDPPPLPEPVDPEHVGAPDAAAALAGLEATLEGYEPRPAQAALAVAVEAALGEERHLVAEAETGVGKSLGYLLPAIQRAQADGEPAVIATRTRALQDQLVRSELPAAERALGRPVRLTVLKGRKSYLCLRKLHAFATQVEQTPPELLSEPEEPGVVAPAMAYAMLGAFARDSVTGDVDELAWSVRQRLPEGLLDSVTSGPAESLGGRCPFRRDCLAERARTRARASDVIVTNHSLLLAERRVLDERDDAAQQNLVLPPYRTLIVDEAHRLEETVSQHATRRLPVHAARAELEGIAAGRLERPLREAALLAAGLSGGEEVTDGDAAGRDAAAQDGPPADAGSGAGGALAAAAEALTVAARAALPRLDGVAAAVGGLAPSPPVDGFPERRWMHDGVRGTAAFGALVGAMDDLRLALRPVYRALTSAVNALDRLPQPSGAATAGPVTGAAETGRLAAALRSDVERWGRVLAVAADPPPAQVVWVEVAPPKLDGLGPRPSLCVAPENVGEAVRRFLAPISSAVLTSATLRAGATDGNFAFLRDRLGLDGDLERPVQFLSLGSPFDFTQQARMLVATDLPRPGREGLDARALGFLADAVTAADGRALVLFTSYRDLERAADWLTPRLEARGILVLAQRRGQSAARLVERLRAEPRAVLLGNRGLWEGTDIPGAALQLVVITKLPFAPFGEPLEEARVRALDRAGRDGWGDYYAAAAAMAFKQGVGRLIRRRTDRGVVVVLDSRVATARYGQRFATALPEGLVAELLPLEACAEAVDDWFGASVGAAAAA